MFYYNLNSIIYLNITNKAKLIIIDLRMSELKKIEKILKGNKEYIKKKFYVEKIGVFGSYSKGKETPESDIDILVEFNGPIGWDFIELNEYLELIIGKKVDLVSIKALKPQLKDDIINKVVYI